MCLLNRIEQEQKVNQHLAPVCPCVCLPTCLPVSLFVCMNGPMHIFVCTDHGACEGVESECECAGVIVVVLMCQSVYLYIQMGKLD